MSVKEKYSQWEATRLAEIEGLSEAEIEALIDTRYPELEYFWSRFGGWKFGRRDVDDDVSEGYATCRALWLAIEVPQEFV